MFEMTRPPKFPGFEKCIKMMRSTNGSISEEGFGRLESKAADYLPQLIAAFWDEDNKKMHFWLIELIGAANSPSAMSFLVERLSDDSESIRYWAAVGLRKLNTKEARIALRQAGLPVKTEC